MTEKKGSFSIITQKDGNKSLKAFKSPEIVVQDPFYEEFQAISTQIVGLKVKYLSKESEIVDFLLKGREKSEKDSYRVTSIINYDFFSDLYPKKSQKESKAYLKTYLHDRLLDVLAEYYEKVGYRVYKEKY
ncbi:MAG: hypothetical protein IH998_09900, partial [Proteobacteria bacterium]|nr:hypothetical protein [Pseudomonadota bacterium]